MNDKSWAITFSALCVLSIIGALVSAYTGDSWLAWLFSIDAIVNFGAMLVAIHLATRGGGHHG